jgi:hypothetical protein
MQIKRPASGRSSTARILTLACPLLVRLRTRAQLSRAVRPQRRKRRFPLHSLENCSRPVSGCPGVTLVQSQLRPLLREKSAGGAGYDFSRYGLGVRITAPNGASACLLLDARSANRLCGRRSGCRGRGMAFCERRPPCRSRRPEERASFHRRKSPDFCRLTRHVGRGGTLGIVSLRDRSQASGRKSDDFRP